MASFRAGAAVSLCLMTLVTMLSVDALTTDFYAKSCPRIHSIVKAEIKKAVNVEKRMAASLIRLHFHDCFVHGCDGSILLDSIPGMDSEKFAPPNDRSARGYEAIDAIKVALEKACPRTVSCADILAIAYRDSAVEVGLVPEYPVPFGRRDSLRAAPIAEVNLRLPGPDFDISTLKASFANQSLDERDLVALSGAHTIGRVRCQFVRLFLNDPGTNADFKKELARLCAPTVDAFTLQNLDLKTPDKFDNNYYKNLRRGEGIIRSDQVLWSSEGTHQKITKDFAENQENFFRQFIESSIKMGKIKPPPGSPSEIRLNCHQANPRPLIEQVVAVE
ncbi:peroxidase E5 [Physcomitrium patens]|uniref:Peroxidase n=1 Tax=Physcomitrium patens TaxID=3218 RepID=A0A2K1IBL0_PHYPA|nr:peroxidase E5-like [Physcomitrium patens]PNR26680.1 hypothetical protein PHYPA_030161 [Physcomitrium patens]|eukprot:XP_024366102.1 peroxidase E5-like [Physcomitrella patens]